MRLLITAEPLKGDPRQISGGLSLQPSPPGSSVLQTLAALSSSDSWLHLNSGVHHASPPKLSRQQAGATRELSSFISCHFFLPDSLCLGKPFFHPFVLSLVDSVDRVYLLLIVG